VRHDLISGLNDNQEEIRQVVVDAALTSLTGRVLERLDHDMPPEIRALLRYALVNARRGVRVTDMAKAL
jgi:hypothetical protein